MEAIVFMWQIIDWTMDAHCWRQKKHEWEDFPSNLQIVQLKANVREVACSEPGLCN
jgi:hypothetical protein